MSQHEGLTLDELKAAFSFQKNMDTVFMEYKTYCEIMEKKGKCEFLVTVPKKIAWCSKMRNSDMQKLAGNGFR